jgi:hypothetical protein
MQFQKINNSQISLLICSRDNPIAMRRLVDRVKKMDCSYQFEITVIEETDIPTAIEGVRYIQLPVHNRGIAYARNQALKYSKGVTTSISIIGSSKTGFAFFIPSQKAIEAGRIRTEEPLILKIDGKKTREDDS